MHAVLNVSGRLEALGIQDISEDFLAQKIEQDCGQVLREHRLVSAEWLLDGVHYVLLDLFRRHILILELLAQIVLRINTPVT